MKQYQIITLIVICLTVFTVYQIQRGLLQQTHNFLVESIEKLPESPSLLPASSDGTLPSANKELSKPTAAKEPAAITEEIEKVKKSAEAKVSQTKDCLKATPGNKAQVQSNPSETKIESGVLVKESSPVSGTGCMGFILY
ncbi:MAG: hypothetical protein ACR2MX_06725 [Cyclobacteriaceae bacterium]